MDVIAKESSNKQLVVGVDASRNRSGGAIANLLGIIREGDPVSHGIQEVHVWAYKKLADALPDRSWLVKHSPLELEKSLLRQIWWQYQCLPKEARKAHCDVLYSTDAATVCRFKPMVVMSQDLLSYEPGTMRHFGYTRARLRLLAILYLQNRAFRHAAGVIFLTRYAAQIIQRACGVLPYIAIIPHGVGEDFKKVAPPSDWPTNSDRPIRCIYVSNAALHKHQWFVVEAIAALRKRGHNLTLALVGGGSGQPQGILEKQIVISDPGRTFVDQTDFLPQEDLPSILASAHLFIFASSCEAFGITLLEGMAVGLPVACSNRSAMPEILKDGGAYFDPEDHESIAAAIERIITKEELRMSIAKRAKELSEQYSWQRCADETLSFIVETYKRRKT